MQIAGLPGRNFIPHGVHAMKIARVVWQGKHCKACAHKHSEDGLFDIHFGEVEEQMQEKKKLKK